MDGDGRAAGTPAMALQADVDFNTDNGQVPGAARKATGGEDHSALGPDRGVDHQGNCPCCPVPPDCYGCLRLYTFIALAMVAI